MHLLAFWARCGRDANGSYLATELRTLLDEFGIDDHGEREAVFALADQIDAEAAQVQRERHNEAMEKLKK